MVLILIFLARIQFLNKYSRQKTISKLMSNMIIYLMQVGRYWTKEERKRQLERARERKQRQQEIILKQHPEHNSDLLICDCTEGKTLKKPINIVELSHKKMSRKKVILDDFTTVQEMLVHGNRVGTGVSSDGNKLIGLLSVTTV